MKRIPLEWTSYKYYDPKVVLPRLYQPRIAVAASETREKIKNLRTNELKAERESWHAAIFCYLLSRMQNTDIYFSRVDLQTTTPYSLGLMAALNASHRFR